MNIEKITQIRNFFKEYIFGFMLGDIKVAKDNGLNFLSALGLMEYTEILGGFVTGNLKERGELGNNFRAFLKYMGQEYIDLDKEIDLYKRVRCGLAHEYFIKGKSSAIVTHYLNPIPCGIIYERDKDRIHFVVQKYYEDFEKATKKYHDKMVNEEEQNLIKLFEKALQVSIHY